MNTTNTDSVQKHEIDHVHAVSDEKWYASFNDEDGFQGPHPTREAAIADLIHDSDVEENATIYTAKGQPVTLGSIDARWNWEQIIENAGDEYHETTVERIDDRATNDLLAELEAALNVTLNEWLEKNGILKGIYALGSAAEHTVTAEDRAAITKAEGRAE